MITREQILALLQGDDALRALLQTTAGGVGRDMDDALGATKGDRTGERGAIAAAATAES